MFLTSWIKYSDIPQSTSWKQSNCIQVISSLQLSFNIKIIFQHKTQMKIKDKADKLAKIAAEKAAAEAAAKAAAEAPAAEEATTDTVAE